MQGVRDGFLGRVELAAIRKRIGRDVDHAHDERALAERKFAACDRPGKIRTLHCHSCHCYRSSPDMRGIVRGFAIKPDLLFSWAFYAAAVLLGSLLKDRLSVPRLALAALAGSVGFFVVSNFAVWAVWQMYPKTLAGLGACYVAALPFFRNALVGDLMWSAVLFGAPLLIAHNLPQTAKVRA